MKKTSLLLLTIITVAFLGSCGDGGSNATATAESSTTTTTIPALTAAQVLASLPLPTELPIGWSFSGEETTTTLEPDSGPGKGLCGGPNAATRAQAQGAVGYAATSYVLSEPGANAGIAVYAFPSADAANTFMNASSYVSVVCPSGVDYPKTNEGRTYNINEKSSVGSAALTTADNSFTIYQSTTTKPQGSTAQSNRSTVIIYARYGDVVLSVSISGILSQTGNWVATDFYTPKVEVVQAAVEQFAKVMQPKLGIRPHELTPSTTTTSIP